MDDVIPGFVQITVVAKEYATSRKSVERRRDSAREAGDSTVYRQFKLRTKDGKTFDEPSLEQVKKLRADGRVPEWFVAREWLRKTFGKRETDKEEGSEQSKPSQIDPESLENHPYVRMLKEAHGARVSDLQKQLQAAERREERMSKLIESVNNTTQALNRTLALPGIAKAARAQQHQTIDLASNESQPARENGNETNGETAQSAHGQSSPDGKRRRKSWLRRLINRGD